MNTTQAIIATLLATGLSVSVSAFAKDTATAFAEPAARICCASPAAIAVSGQVNRICCARTFDMPASEQDATPPEMATRAAAPVGTARIWW